MKQNDRIRLNKIVTRIAKDLFGSSFTRPEIQSNIEKYGVMVDGSLHTSRMDWVYPYQEISIAHWVDKNQIVPENISVFFEGHDFLIIHKPRGVVSMAGAGHSKDTVTSWLQSTYPSFEKNFPINHPFPENSLVHRLDKDTMGLLLIGKTFESREFYQNQFRSRSVKKKYLAVHKGIFNFSFTIEAWQSRDLRNPVKQKLFWEYKQALEYHSESRKAISRFSPIVYDNKRDLTLSEIEIFTGRTHQIRLQSEAAGFPLYGERIYNNQFPISNHLHDKQLESKALNLPSDQFNEVWSKLNGDLNYTLISNFLAFTDTFGKKNSHQLIHLEKLINQFR